MGRKRVYHTSRIDSVTSQIALWELRGLYEQAEGLRRFFGAAISEDEIEESKAQFARANEELAANYVPAEPQEDEPNLEAIGLNSVLETAKAGGALPAGFWLDSKMIKGNGPYQYLRWRQGRSQKSKYLGKVKK